MKTLKSAGIIIYQHTGNLEGEELKIYSFSSDPTDREAWLTVEQLKYFNTPQERKVKRMYTNTIGYFDPTHIAKGTLEWIDDPKSIEDIFRENMPTTEDYIKIFRKEDYNE